MAGTSQWSILEGTTLTLPIGGVRPTAYCEPILTTALRFPTSAENLRNLTKEPQSFSCRDIPSVLFSATNTKTEQRSPHYGAQKQPSAAAARLCTSKYRSR